jgi:hypothetical protein
MTPVGAPVTGPVGAGGAPRAFPAARSGLSSPTESAHDDGRSPWTVESPVRSAWVRLHDAWWYCLETWELGEYAKRYYDYLLRHALVPGQLTRTASDKRLGVLPARRAAPPTPSETR